MEFHDCIRALKTYRFFILALTLLSGVSAWAVSSYLLVNIFESSATIFVSSNQNGVLLDSNSIRVFYNLAESESVAENVASVLDLNIPAEKLREQVKIEVDYETGILKIIARTDDARQSKNIAQAFIDILQSQSDNFVLKVSIHVIDAPKIAKMPSSPNLIFNTVLSAAGGVMGGFLLALLFSMREQSKANLSPLTGHPELSVLGCLPKIGRKRSKDAQPVCAGSKAADEAVKGVRTSLLFQLEHASVRSVIVTSPRPSEGKTTCALNIACSMANLKKRVLLVDCSFERPTLYKITDADGLPPQYHTVSEYVIKSLTRLGVDILSNMAPAGQSADFESFRSMIATMEQHYDLILIDCPPLLSSADTRMLSSIIRHVILVTDYRNLTYPAIEKATHSLSQISAVILGIVVNRAPHAKILQ